MDIGFISEAELFDGASYYHRYQDLIREVLHAEQVGFDFFSLSEQHFMHGATLSAPECFVSHLIPMTSRIRFLYGIILTPRQINHPLRIAERVAMQDLLSHGRIDLGLGRVNTTLTIKAFEVDPDETRDQMLESIEVIRAAFVDEPFGYDGKFFKIPHRYLVPKPYQQPHPPITIAATSPEMQEKAAELKLGAMAGSSFFGLGYLAELASLYWGKAGTKIGEPPFSYGSLMHTCCAPTDEEAREIAADAIYKTAEFSLRGYLRLAQHYPSYSYMSRAEECLEKIKDLDWLINESGMVICGSPETCVKQLERFRDIGITKAILRIDGQGHKRVMQSIDLIGRHVIPHFKPQFKRPPAAMMAHTAR